MTEKASKNDCFSVHKKFSSFVETITLSEWKLLLVAAEAAQVNTFSMMMELKGKKTSIRQRDGYNKSSA